MSFDGPPDSIQKICMYTMYTLTQVPVTFQADAMFRVHWEPLPPAVAQESNEQQKGLEGTSDTTTDTSASCRR